jgi:competence protein ComEC
VTDLRLVPAALAAWAVAVVAVGARPGHVLVAACGAATLAAACAALVVVPRAVGRRAAGNTHRSAATVRGGQTVLVVACAAAVLLSSGTQLATRAGGGLEELAQDGATARVTATVRSAVEPRLNPWTGATDRHEVRVEATEVESRGVTAPATGPLVVTGPGQGWDDLAYGAQVEVVGRLAADGDRTFVRTDVAPRVVVPPTAPLRAVHAMRQGVLDVTAGLSPQARGLVPGVAVGDTSRLDPELDEAMRTTSLTHVTAVSGGHFAIIVATVAALCVALRAPRVVRVLVTAAAMVGFVVLVHPEPSVVRAAAMGAVGLAGALLGRPSRAVAALAGAVVVLLVLDPWLARSYGFVLSVAATAGLALGTAPIARRLAPWCGRTVAHVVAVPVAAQLACAPIVVLLDPSVSLYAVPANLVAAPALGPATVLGVLATLLAPVWPAAATAVATLAGAFTWWLAGVAQVFAALPAARVPWPGGAGGVVLLAAVSALALAVLLRSRRLAALGERREVRRGGRDPAGVGVVAVRAALQRRRRTVAVAAARSRARRGRTGTPSGHGHASPDRPPHRRPRPSRVVGTVIVAVVVVAAVWSLGRPVATRGGTVPADWAVVACDVGQGDALALRSGGSSAVVVDVGPSGPAADRCLDDLGVTRVDLLVLSHFHADHVGGLEDVLRGRTVDRALVTATRDPADQAERALGLLEAAGVPVDVARPGDAATTGQGADAVAWEVLQAGPPVAGGGGEEGGANDASVVLLAEVHGTEVITLGDLEDDGQAALVDELERRGTGPVDVVKMAHHGSRTQSEALATVLSPTAALVSSGENTYGHPTDHALDLYRGTGATVLRTDTCGTFALVVRDDALAAVGCRDPARR